MFIEGVRTFEHKKCILEGKIGLFRGVKCNIPKRLPGVHLGERPLYFYLARDMRTKARPTTYERAWAYGEVEQWAEAEVERELAEIDEWIA